MAMTTDEAVAAYTAAKQLRALYDAYRAASRAHHIVLQRLAKAGDPESADYAARLGALQSRAALARETDLAFGVRAEELRRRLEELRREHPIP